LRGLAIDDILSQGGDREPGPWARRLAIIAALVVLAAAGGVYLGLSRHQHAPAAAASPAPTGSAALSLPPGPGGIAGQTLAWDRGLLLPAAGARPAWFSPASGRSEPIGGLPANQSGYQFTRVGGGWAVQSSPAPPAACDGCAWPPAPAWFLPDGARSVTRAGPANLVAPAATAGAVWLTTYAPGATMNTAAGTAREATATGALSRPVRLPPGYAIVQGTSRGLLLAPVSRPPGAAYRLWDPAAPRASQAFDGVLAASPGEVAWAPPCAARCGVQALNLATGRRTVIALPAGSTADSGAFSPDGALLALQLSSGNTGDGLAMRLEVAPVASGRLTAVPGTYVSGDALVGFGWPAAGDNLVAEFNFTTKTQLALWRPGASYPAVTVVRPGPGPASLILG
jgi:hypothetical protein